MTREPLDYLVIGAGPAGVQLGYYLKRAGHDHLVLEAGPTPGTFYRKFPRHRQMISINKPYSGWDDPDLRLRVDWNSLLDDETAGTHGTAARFTEYTDRYFPHADDYIRYLTDFAAHHDLRIRYDTAVVRVARDGERGLFEVTDEHGTVHRARRVVAAIGFGRGNVPDIPGIETAETYQDVSVDRDDFTNQRVLIIGKGNSAFETADHLTERAAVIHIVGPSSIKFAWKTHFIGHLRAVNNNFLDTYQLKAQNSVLDGTVESIERLGDGYAVAVSYGRRDEVAHFTYDRVICCTGFAMDGSMFAPECAPQLAIRDRFPALTSAWESVNVPDLYFAGTLTQVRDFKKYTSAFIHGFRYGVRALGRVLERRYEGVEWPHRVVPADPAVLAQAILDRLATTSALWQQFTFLCDLFVVAGGEVRHYEEMPVDYLHDTEFGESGLYFTVTLEYAPGHDELDPFDVPAGRAWEDEHKHDDRYLHPVVRCFNGAEVVLEHRVKENLDNDWTDPVIHVKPLVDHLATALSGPARAGR
ncbi:NAD(P)-binding domain-containing protein [Streptomyces sp. TS71-3]|uniref:NAD(P)-binding domain-containing protein n=1 Tax=Streptomyces sp. TS71-3 TaxID=2733862 RepID=UPI001B0F2F82|nr:NAD(P)-binding domain-containing protein [Streptomyces sp. TS71-3]GHJ36923.1 pyridine nucleotide-disulfide oxidoreductase [Streptomyces sp. TS71-3]